MDLQSHFDISQAPDKAAFKRRLIDFAHHMNFPIVGATLVTEQPDKGPVFKYIGNRPEAFLAGADVELAKVDPLMTRIRRNGLPVTYDQKFYVEAGAPALWEVAAPYGYRTGIMVALRLSRNQQFLLGLDREQPLPQNERRLVRMMAELQLLAIHCQDAAERLLAPLLPEAPVKLTARELEVLKWTAEGKTAWETGMILGISERTANLHLQAASRKLNSMNKHQAVLRALRLGLIH